MQDFLQLDSLPQNLAYLLYSTRQVETVLDLLLVSLTYFLILVLIRRSQAAVLLRGVLILALIAVAVSALFQLPTFTYMLRAALIICLIATPLIFQPELRRGLERLGRTFGFLQIRPTELVHRVVPTLIRTAGNLSTHHTGGLIVLEGASNLTDVINTGVILNAALSPDLLETIFQDKGPLHDGAVIIREDEIIAAATVLPLSESPLPRGMHQGTRHRAALGISETSDALALVISEETGDISVALRGELHRKLDTTELRDFLNRFYDPLQPSTKGIKDLLSLSYWRSQPKRLKTNPRTRLMRIVSFVSTAALALLLAVATWLVVAEQVNPPQTVRIDNIPLRTAGLNQDLLIVSNIPAEISAEVQAPQDIAVDLSPQSLRATVNLEQLSAGDHRVAVDVRPVDDQVRVITKEPGSLDMELQPRATRTMTVALVIPDRETLPFSYEITGDPSVTPPQVLVTGPAEVMETLNRVEVSVPLRGARASVNEERPVVLKDAEGNLLAGLTTDPADVQVAIPISQRFNTRDAAVHVVITGTVAPGYWISNINVEPKTVTLLGPPSTLEQIGGFVDTVPVDVTGAAGDIVRRVPLAPPAGVSALNERGVSEGSVEVRISVVPQLSNLRLTLPVEVTGGQPTDTTSQSPAFVDVLLSGPLPILNQVNADPKLVRVLVDVAGLAPGSHDLTPTLITPEGLRATVVPNTVQIRIDRPPTP
ncbi:MAG TPA: diadenylate cyclase CdaA [Anaerolineae bacterium]|nr:diadenylate cyclase CdaA [Anaerolineae bacterium]